MSVEVEAAPFAILLGDSVVSRTVPYERALQTSQIRFDDLVSLSRKADVPYSLLFGSRELAQEQVRLKQKRLLAGLSKRTFSMNSRSEVELRDIELIVKDLLRKQELLKKLDRALPKNTFVGSLRGPRRDVVADARRFRSMLGFTTSDIREADSKESAFEFLVQCFERNQVLVSQSQQHYMPQRIPTGIKFSGISIRDAKVPYIFVSSGEGSDLEPAGRRIMTLVLLGAMIARGRFAAMSYDNRSARPIVVPEYALAEEVLLPREELRDLKVSSLDLAKESAERFRVTPSALVMRARRLGLLEPDTADEYLSDLQIEFSQRKKKPLRSPRPATAIRKYNGNELTRRMLGFVDSNSLSAGDFCRIVCLNKIKPSGIDELRGSR